VGLCGANANASGPAEPDPRRPLGHAALDLTGQTVSV
jgi:hypothetical protein